MEVFDMNRALFAMALGLGMSLMGCATGVDDPLPPEPARQEQRDPPKQALTGNLRDPQEQLLVAVEIENGLSDVPAKQIIPGPLPPPESE
jgi:hypothetical protein